MILIRAVSILLVTVTLVNSNVNEHELVEDKNILLRKLKSLEEAKPTANEIEIKPSWTEKIADIFIKSIELLSTSNVKDNSNYSETVPLVEKSPLLIRCFSEVLSIYKKYVYDRIWYKRPPERDVSTNTDEPASSNPNDEVEIIEPKYHGKLCDATGCETAVTSKILKETPEESQTETPKVIVKRENAEHETNLCGEGTVRDEKGNCVFIADVKSQRFIFNVPNHCPFGYKKDKLGYCRPLW